MSKCSTLTLYDSTVRCVHSNTYTLLNTWMGKTCANLVLRKLVVNVYVIFSAYQAPNVLVVGADKAKCSTCAI